MKATIESTDKIVKLVVDGREIPARIWEGTSENGVPFHCFITRVAVAHDQDESQFQAELQEHRPPSAAVAGTYFGDARLIL